MTTRVTRYIPLRHRAAGFVLDRAGKMDRGPGHSLHDTIQVIPGFFRLTHVENRGAAFGLFRRFPLGGKITRAWCYFRFGACIVSVLLWRNSTHAKHRPLDWL